MTSKRVAYPVKEVIPVVFPAYVPATAFWADARKLFEWLRRSVQTAPLPA